MRYTEREICDILGKRGFRLISKFTSTANIHTLECARGHRFDGRLSCYLYKNGCLSCYKEDKAIGKDKIQEWLSKYGFSLTSDVGSITSFITFTCSRGHPNKIRIDSMKRRHPMCGVCDKGLKTTSIVTEDMRILGYRLHSEYINSVSPLKVECPSGHIYETSWSEFKRAKKYRCCPTCQAVGKTKRLTLPSDVVEQTFDRAGLF